MVRIKPKKERTEIRCNLCDQLIGWEIEEEELEDYERTGEEVDFNIEADGWMTGYAVGGSHKKYPFDYCPECAKIAITAFKAIRISGRDD